MWLSQEANHKIEKQASWGIFTIYFSVKHTQLQNPDNDILNSLVFIYFQLQFPDYQNFYHFVIIIFKLISLRPEILFTLYYKCTELSILRWLLEKAYSWFVRWDLWKLYLYWKGTLKWWVRDGENIAPSVFSLEAVILLLRIPIPWGSSPVLLLPWCTPHQPVWLSLLCVCDLGHLLFFHHSTYYRLPVDGSLHTSSRTRTMYSVS